MFSSSSDKSSNDRLHRTTTTEDDTNTPSVVSNNDEMTNFLGYIFQDSAHVDTSICSDPNSKFDMNTTPQALSQIKEPTSSDVLCGRGKRVNTHKGNIGFREIVQKYKFEYVAGHSSISTAKKSQLAARVVVEVRSLDPPGRFLEVDKRTGLWEDIGDARAKRKAGQGLREDAHAFCKKWEPENILKDINNPSKHSFGSNMNSKECPAKTFQNEARLAIVEDTPRVQNEMMELPVKLTDYDQIGYMNSHVLYTPALVMGPVAVEAYNIQLENVKRLHSSFKPELYGRKQDKTKCYGTRLGFYGPHLKHRRNDISITSKKDKMTLPVGISDIKTIFWSFKTSTPPDFFNPAA